MIRRLALVVALAATVGLATMLAARAQEKPKAEWLRVDLASTFQPTPGQTGQLIRGMLVMADGEVRSQDFRIPVEIPLGHKITEVGVIGTTSNRMAVKIERLDWTAVYEGTATTPENTGSWFGVEVVDRGTVRRTAKPVSDDDKKPEPPVREKTTQELQVVAYLARDPNLTPESRRASAQNQRDRIHAIWLKIEKK